ncbi:MAG: ABC transporter ATP-binding protein, partial [Clostridiales bacterium]|nr:ABC transporter ATP-binding protein [Clostridiales bacterium]
MNPIFSCRHITQEFEHFKLADITFALEAGCILGVIGRNGSGKTTLLRTLMGMQSTQGDAKILGYSLQKDEKEYKKRIAYVLNESPFRMNVNALTNGRLFGRYYDSFDLERYKELLERYEILEHPEKLQSVRQGKKNIQALNRLSQGQQIQQQLAFALSYDASVYFMDEPTGNLDVEFRDTFYEETRKLVSDERKSVIYASHLIEEMEYFADYILWLREQNGISQIYFYGTVDELRDRYRIIEAEDEVLREIPSERILGGRKETNHNEWLIDVEQYELPASIRECVRYPEL